MRSRLLAAACLMPLALAACGSGETAPDNVLPMPPPPPPEPAPPPPAPIQPDNNVVPPAPPGRNCSGPRRLQVPCTGPPTLRSCYIEVPCLEPVPPMPPLVAPPAANRAD